MKDKWAGSHAIKHGNLTAIDKENHETTILPLSTSDDVIVDDQGNFLSDALPMFTTDNGDDATTTGVLSVEDDDQDTEIDDDVLAKILG